MKKHVVALIALSTVALSGCTNSCGSKNDETPPASESMPNTSTTDPSMQPPAASTATQPAAQAPQGSTGQEGMQAAPATPAEAPSEAPAVDSNGQGSAPASN